MSKQNIFIADCIQRVIELHRDVFDESFSQLPVYEQIDLQAHRILEAHQQENDAVCIHVTCWHPTMVGWKAEQVMASELTLDDARQTMAREYGFESWSVARERGAAPPDTVFEAAVDAVLSGDLELVTSMLQAHPRLICQRSRYGHRSTLLHYIGSNGVETHRQVVPMNAVEVAQLLIDAGADVNAEANMYGGSRTLGLVGTSAHPAEAGVQDELVQCLKAAGATA